MKKSTWAGVAIAAALALVLTGCGPDHGTIHDKSHTEGYYYTTQVCSGYYPPPNNALCMVYVPVQNYMPPSWSFDLYASEDEHGWVRVDEGTYNSYDIGDYFEKPTS